MQVKPFFRRLWGEANDENIPDVAAMMTYYAVFALFPMMVFVVTIALLVTPADTLDSALAMLSSAMPSSVARMIADEVHRMADAAGAGFAIGGALLALWGASRGTAALMGALNTIFSKKETRPWWKRQGIAIACTLVLATLSLLAVAILAVGPAGSAIAAEYGLGNAFDVTWSVGRWIGAGLLVMFIWALLYWWLPDTDAPFRIFTPGAILGVLLWLGVTRLFGIYLDRFAQYQATYGALGGVIILLMWLWLSNMVLLLGAEINDVLADLRRHDSRAAAKLAHASST